MKEEYDIGPMDVLRYLKDHTDVRTRHSAYGKSQTIAAVRTTIAAHSNEMDPSVLLFRVNYLDIGLFFLYNHELLFIFRL
jgi:hypothetical protein